MRTHKTAAKRLEVTGNGKLRRTRGMRGHLHEHRSKRSLALLAKKLPVHKGDAKRMRRLVPYLKMPS